MSTYEITSLTDRPFDKESNQQVVTLTDCRGIQVSLSLRYLPVWPEKNRQKSMKVAQK